MNHRESIEWRMQLLRWKRNGFFPEARTSDIIKMFLPNRISKFLSIVRREKTHRQQVLWRTPIGFFWGSEEDGPTLNAVAREHLRGVYQRRSVTVQPGDVVLDLGAYLGDFTRLALNRGAKLVVCFEPDRRVIPSLNRTFEHEILAKQVVLVSFAAWRSPGVSPFSGARGIFRAAGAEPLTDTEMITTTTVDDVVDDLKLERVDFIKMDIEGAELFALEGAQRTVFQFSPRMAICTYHSPGDASLISQRVLSLNPAYTKFFNRRREQAYFHKKCVRD